jgi:Methyltransferase domain
VRESAIERVRAVQRNGRGERLDRYAARGFWTVEGWLSPGAIRLTTSLDRAQRAAGVRGHVGEIGVHHGAYFILLYLMRRPGERGIAVDVFERQELNVDGSGNGNLQAFLANLETHAGDTRDLVVIAEDSRGISCAEVIARAGGGMRLFSIDAGHTADLTEHDLRTATGAIVPGGIVVVDDYFNSGFPGVSEGVNRFFAGDAAGGIVPFAIGANKMFLTTAPHAADYISALAQDNTGTHRVASKPQVIFAQPVIHFDFDRRDPPPTALEPRADIFRTSPP